MNRKFAVAISLVAGSLLTATAQQPTGGRPNLLSNPSFEDGETDWVFSSWNSKGTVAIDTEENRDGKASIRIDNASPDDSFLRQTVKVKPQTRYRLTAYIKTKDVLVKGTGATIALEGGFEKTESVTGKKSWTRVSFEFSTGPLDTIKIGPRLGHNSSLATGTSWYDDLSLVELGPERR